MDRGRPLADDAGAGGPSDGDFGTLGEGGLGSSAGTGYTVIAGTTVTLADKTSGALLGQPGFVKGDRLVLQIAPGMVGRHFGDVEVVGWDAPYYHLPDEAAVRDYLVGRLMPPDEAERAAQQVDTPVDVTKRGVLVFARRLDDL